MGETIPTRPHHILMKRRIFQVINGFPALATRAEAVAWAFDRLRDHVDIEDDFEKFIEFAAACLRLTAGDLRQVATEVISADQSVGTDIDEDRSEEELVDTLRDINPNYVLSGAATRDESSLLPRAAFVSDEAYERYMAREDARLAAFKNAFGEFVAPGDWRERFDHA